MACIVISGAAFAKSPPTSCSSGAILQTFNDVNLVEDRCSTGYIDMGEIPSVVQSCAQTYSGIECWLYAPANTEFDDETGFYIFENEICPLS